jgi:hypothetical protein
MDQQASLGVTEVLGRRAAGMSPPEEYLARAARAQTIADHALSSELRDSFLSVAEGWRRLANIAGLIPFRLEKMGIRRPPNQA